MSELAKFLAARDLLLAQRTDYAEAVRGFRWPALDRFNWALDYFDPMAHGDARIGLHVVEETGAEAKRSFAELAQRSNQAANLLRGLGVARGDRVLLMLGNEIALWEAMLACMKLGAVMIPATTLLAADDLRDRLERGQVKHVIAGSVHAPKFADAPGDYTRIAVGAGVAGWRNFAESEKSPITFVPDGLTRASDPLLLYFTSGTTSKPKLVLHTHASYPVGHLSTMYWLGLQPGDVHLNISSPGWAKHAWSCFFAPWNAGATVFLYNYARFDARAMLGVLVKHRVTTLCAPPTVWRMLIQSPELASTRTSLRELCGAGEPLNPEVIERVRRAWGLTIRDGFGQTETTAQIGNTPGQRLKPGSMGRPLPGYQVRLLDADGTPQSEGEICLALEPRPLGLMVGYTDDATKNAEALRHAHYHTGDTASVDADGYVTYVGRADDVFKASDYRISPFELESVLIEHPAIAEAAVVPSPDALRLAVPKAFVVTRAGFAPSRELAQDVFGFLRNKLAPYQRIRRLEFAELPKTISGKIRRVELRASEARRDVSVKRANEWFEEEFAARG